MYLSKCFSFIFLYIKFLSVLHQVDLWLKMIQRAQVWDLLDASDFSVDFHNQVLEPKTQDFYAKNYWAASWYEWKDLESCMKDHSTYQSLYVKITSL